MNGDYNVFIADESVKDEWNQYLERKSSNAGLNCFEWSQVLRDSYHPILRFFYVKDRSNQIVGVLPAYITASLKNRNQLFSNRQGMLADNEEVAALLVDAARNFAKEYSVVRAEIASGIQKYNLPLSSYAKNTIRLDLTISKKDLWKSLRDKTRNAIRKGSKYQLIIKEGQQLLPKFYHIYSSRMVNKSVFLLSLRFFKSLLKHFDDQSKIYVAFKGKKPIATMLVVYFGSTAVYAYGGMLAGYEKYCPNQYLLWHIIEECYKKEISMLDLGESKVGSGVYKFKTWFGGVPKPVYYYNLLALQTRVVDQEPVQKKISSLEKIYNSYMARSPALLKKPLLKILKRYGRLI